MTEVKSYHEPPEEVGLVVQATLAILDQHSKNWVKLRSKLKMIGKDNIMNRIAQVDIEKLKPKNIEKADDLLKNLTYQGVLTVSKPLAAFYLWVMDISDQYAEFSESKEIEGTRRESFAGHRFETMGSVNAIKIDMTENNLTERPDSSVDGGCCGKFW